MRRDNKKSADLAAKLDQAPRWPLDGVGNKRGNGPAKNGLAGGNGRGAMRSQNVRQRKGR